MRSDEPLRTSANDQGWRWYDRFTRSFKSDLAAEVRSGNVFASGVDLGNSNLLGYESRRLEFFLAACTQPHPRSRVGETRYTLRN
jgi:hypothetical protein